MSRFARAMLNSSTYVFPLVAFPLLALAWWRGGGWPLAVYLLGVPLVFGYAMPGIATNVVKRWTFRGPWVVGGAYAHHGVIYAAKMSFVLWLVTRDPAAPRSPFDTAALVALAGAATAFGGWWHDVYAVRDGRIQLAGTDPAAAEHALGRLMPTTYFAIGATYAALGLAGARILAADASALPWLFSAALAALSIIPTAIFLALDPGARRMIALKLARRPTHGR